MANLVLIDISSFHSGCILQKLTEHLSALLLLAVFIFGFSSLKTDAQAQEQATEKQIVVPLFRHIDPSKKDPDFKSYQVIRFSVTDDFPPFSYRTSNGALTGFNIAVANALCRILRVECLFSVKPFDQANKAIESEQADAVITGLVENTQTAKSFSFTRPYYRFSARFAVRKVSTIKGNDVRDMAGKRLGAIAGTQHAAFLKENFNRSKLRAFDNADDAYDGLRTGAVDALFGDSLQMMFWLKGEKSKNCCRFVGNAYLDLATFSRPMAIAVGVENKKLRDLLDHALDRLQISGRYGKIFRQYFPLSPWQDSQEEKSNAT